MRISDWSSDVCSSDLIANKRNPLSYLFLTSPAKAGAQLRPARYWAPAFAGEVFGRSARIGLHAIRLGPVDIQPMPACKWRFPALPVLTYRKYAALRSEEHTSELQSLMRISYAVFCLKKKK